MFVAWFEIFFVQYLCEELWIYWTDFQRFHFYCSHYSLQSMNSSNIFDDVLAREANYSFQNEFFMVQFRKLVVQILQLVIIFVGHLNEIVLSSWVSWMTVIHVHCHFFSFQKFSVFNGSTICDFQDLKKI